MAPLGAVVAGPAATAFSGSAVQTAGGLLIVLPTVTVLLIPEIRHTAGTTPNLQDHYLRGTGW
jgi:hypothetical protein